MARTGQNASVVLIIVMSLAASATGQLKTWDDLRVKFSPNRQDGFFELPRTTEDPLLKDYVRVDYKTHFPIKLYCLPGDPRVCPFFDTRGLIAGIQVSLIDSDLNINNTLGAFPFSYERSPIYIKSYVFNIPAWAIRVWFTNPEKLPRRSLNETADGIFIHVDGELVQLSREDPGTQEYLNFVRQGCTNGMGLHYHLGLRESARCEDATTVFGLYHCNSLIGIGVGGFGRQTFLKQPWFEAPPLEAIQDHTPFMPPCLPSWTRNYGMTTLHIYLVSEPWAFQCSSCERK